jgi:hypothetical protein
VEYQLNVEQGVDLYRRFRYSEQDSTGARTPVPLDGKEIRGAIKAVKSSGSYAELMLDLTPHLVAVAGQVGVFDLTLPGSATRLVTKSGRYDIFISDPGVQDTYARKPLSGAVVVVLAVTDPA